MQGRGGLSCLVPDRRPKYRARHFPRIGQGDMIPTRIVSRDPRPLRGIAGDADGVHALLPACGELVCRGEHFQLNASVPRGGGAPFQPYHGQFQPPAPQSVRVDQFPIVPATRVQESIFPRPAQPTPLTSVHAGLSAGRGGNCRLMSLPPGSGAELPAGLSTCASPVRADSAQAPVPAFRATIPSSPECYAHRPRTHRRA